MSHNDLFARFVDAGVVSESSKGIAAVMWGMVHVELSHDSIPVAVVIDCPGVVVAEFVGDQVFSVLRETVFDQGDNGFMYRDNPVLSRFCFYTADHISFV